MTLSLRLALTTLIFTKKHLIVFQGHCTIVLMARRVVTCLWCGVILELKREVEQENCSVNMWSLC